MSNGLAKYHEQLEEERLNLKKAKHLEVLLTVEDKLSLEDNINFIERLIENVPMTVKQRSNFNSHFQNIKSRLKL